MLFADGALGLLLIGLWLFCLIDVITSDESQIRNLPKLVWLAIVLLLFDLGALAWLIAGRDWNRGAKPTTAMGRKYPEYDRPGRHVPQNPDDDDVFLAQVRARADAQRKQYQERRKRELDAEREALRERPEPDDPR